jgi:hypothetical protein
MKPIEIRIVSSLTDEDERKFVSAVLTAVRGLLEEMPCTYAVLVGTTQAQVLQHTDHGESAAAEPVDIPAHPHSQEYVNRLQRLRSL